MSNKTLRLGVNGAAGRMGQRVVSLAAADGGWQIAAGLEAPGHGKLGEDVGLLAGIGALGVPVTVELPSVDVAIDFSTPAGATAICRQCVARGVPLVVATTGLESHERREIEQAAQKIPILWAPSMSLAVNLAMKLSQIAAAALKDHPSGVDVEIIERHHRFKEDSPSGTALRFGQLIGEIMGQNVAQHGRSGRPGQRSRDEIGYHAVRTGDNPGEHTIVFGLLGETLELKVSATNRDGYAQGALAAAKFLVGKPAGLYGMNDVLGF